MVSIEELKLGNETLEALKYLLLNVSELEGELKTIDMEELRQNNILIKKNLAETKETLETIKPLEQKAQNVFNELAKTQEKLTELDALRKKIENLSALGLVNDTLVDTDHTYSSSKINKLIENTSLSTTTSLQSFVSNELKTSSDNLESKYATLSQNISTLQSSLSSGLSNADAKFTLKTDFEASKQDANNKFALKTELNQTWQDVKSQRQAGEIYTNNTDKPIFISVVCQASSPSATYEMWLEVNDIRVQRIYSGVILESTPGGSVCGVIPVGATYKITTQIVRGGSPEIIGWTELR